ncbi:MAG TPA: beta-propeller fold lactonase family protein [Acidobacteriaceae bacterium]|jgi:hypothetical protein|nr:beta-propeller fold lactonase family protein [Acidobacteriaceae bacterium]
MRPIFLASLLLLIASAGAQNRFVYVNNQSPSNTVSGFAIGTNGTLTQLSDSPFLTTGSGGGTSEDPEGLTLVPIRDATVLYATNDGSGSISAFTVNPQTGALQLTGSPFLLPDTSGDYSITASPEHRFLLLLTAQTPSFMSSPLRLAMAGFPKFRALPSPPTSA